MSKRKYKKGTDRHQFFLLPPSVDEYVSEENAVRAIDDYVASLDLGKLGFKNAAGEQTPGQPAYDPKMHLKLYLYGYLNRTRSSRRLEAECHRNLEVIWLVQGQRPSYKTIADLRKENLAALQEVNRDFVQVCQELDLFGTELVGIDGTFMRGNVSKDSIFTVERLQRALGYIDADIRKYLEELEQADQQEEGRGTVDPQLAEKLKKLRERKQHRSEQLQQLAESGETQIGEVDEDARLLNKRGGTVAGYNVQIAVDSKNKLLVTAAVVQDGNDEQQLAPMSKAAKEVLGVETLETTEDLGYFNAVQIKECLENGITPYVPEPDKQAQTRQAKRFVRDDFPYDPAANLYRCPNGQELHYSSSYQKGEKKILVYRSSAPVCAQCPVRTKCLAEKSDSRLVTRWEHEAVIEKLRQRMAEKGAEMLRERAAICEHIFGTLKQWCGWTHFLLRGLKKVRAEFSLLMLAYNFKRVLSLQGLAAFRAYCLGRGLQNASGRV